MATSIWCVRPEMTAPIDLVWTNPETKETQTFWVKLKKRLTIGEQRRIMTAGWTGVKPSAKPEIGVDFSQQSFERMLTWVVEWSLEDETRARLPITHDVIETLDPGVFDLIEGAISAHVKALADEKK